MARKYLSYAAAAVKILGEEGGPLHYREITQRFLQDGLVDAQSKTPEASLNAVITVEIKGISSRFVRVSPGVYTLREHVGAGQNGEEQEDDLRVRIPLFPIYSRLRLVLPVWNGMHKTDITHLRTQLSRLWGTPQKQQDWSKPDEWIEAKLDGRDREVAEAVWQRTNHQVNPRHAYGHWLLACTYQLLEEDDNGRMILSDCGSDFVNKPGGKTETHLDEQEGLFKLLALVAEKGPARHGVLLGDWTDYLEHRSKFGSESTYKDTLRRRLTNLLDRKLIERAGTQYTITPAGLTYLGQGTSEETAEPGEEQQLLSLLTKQTAAVRDSIHAILSNMNPIAFEHLIKRLLEEMDYQNVEVTAPGSDGGVDVIADIELGITSVREVVQAKRHKSAIQRKDLDALRGCLHRFQAVRGTIITTGRFASGTVNAAFEQGAAPITLINGEKLVDMLLEKGIGVRKKTYEILELDPDAFAEIEAQV